ncbi:uroporphyrinogen-III synthase [Bacillus sp. 03113]|uniref:uroporphyrinogen-III synthase n=1 Tax=Bacillus sp. 03113 TaxID=2578211 RepID=UPI0011446FAB|nr:uroporphyrinogen-III synthase [Bacillus sp. 03113]
MITSLPLKGKKVLIPRGKKEASSTSKQIIKYGGIPVEIPLIAFKPVPLSEEISKCFMQLHTYDWIIFTSKMAVKSFFSLLETHQPNTFPKIAVIGEKTKKVLENRGYKANFMPSKYVAEMFVDEFSNVIQPGERVLIPKGNLARDLIYHSLQIKGASVDEVIVYINYFPEESQEKLAKMLKEKELDILVFTSSSTVDHFMKVAKEYSLINECDQCITACIGPITKKRMEHYGLSVDVMPSIYTVDGMLKSIINYIDNSLGGEQK